MCSAEPALSASPALKAAAVANNPFAAAFKIEPADFRFMKFSCQALNGGVGIR